MLRSHRHQRLFIRPDTPGECRLFLPGVLGVPAITKEVLRKRTQDYNHWVDAYARKRQNPVEWAEEGVRKEDYVQRWLRRMEHHNQHGVYFIFKSMEQGQTFRSVLPKFPTTDPHYRVLHKNRTRFTHYYFYIRDEVLGPMVLRVASFFPFHTTYYINGHSFIEKELLREGVPFHKKDNAFLAVSDPQALQTAANRLSPEIIRNRLEYWTLVLGPKFSERERQAMNLRRFYSLQQIEFCRNSLSSSGTFPFARSLSAPATWAFGK